MIVGEFSIGDLPKMTNRTAGKQWFSRHKERVKWQRLVEPHCHKLGIVNLKLEKASLTLTRLSSKAPDSDGLVSGFKFVIDSLVKCGVLVDDNYRIIGMPTYLWQYRPKKQGSLITIRIEKP